MSASYTAFKCFCPSKKMLMPLKISEPSGTSQSICTRTFRNLTEYLHPNPPEPHRLCAPKPSGTSPGTRTSFWNLTEYLHQVSVVSPGICTETLQNLTRYLHLEPSGTSTGICTGTLQNLTRYLHRNPPEPCPEPGVEAAPDRTRANLG